MEDSHEGIILGIDYGNDYTQISYFNKGMDKPESISTIIEEQKYLIPTVLCKKKGINEWCIGDEAIHRASISHEIVIKNFYNGLLNKDTEIIENEEYEYERLFSIYIKSIIQLAKTYSKSNYIHTIVFTMESADKKMIDTFVSITSSMGFKKERIKVIGHSESFAYYMVNQPKTLWVNEVVLFEFNAKYFKYYRMILDRGKIPCLLSIEEEDLSSFIKLEQIVSVEGMNLADSKFLELIKEKFRNHFISSVYLLGIGFTKQWFNQSIDLLCEKRKVFQGQNLFSVGACLSISTQIKVNMDEYMLICEGRTKVNVSVLIEHKGINRQLMLSKAGINWYEAGAKTECILDDIRNIQLIITSPISKSNRNISIELEGFPYRPNKTTRIELVIFYQSHNHFDIIIKDKGFGDLFKASEKVIKRTINVENYM